MSVVTEPPKAAAKKKDHNISRVIVLDSIAEEGLDILDSETGIQYEIRTGLAGEELRKALNQFDGAVCRSGVNITAESLEGNTSLKAIVRAGVGTDNIDKTAATRLGIVVMNTPAGNTVSTAEHAMALMLGLSRNLAPAHASLKEGKWNRKAFEGSQLAGKTLGIIGLGRIGQEVARRAKAFDMSIIGFDPFLSSEQAEKLGIKKVDNVKDLLPVVDYLTVHTPLTPETKNLIDSAEIALMKQGVRLINCARGGIYNEQALVAGIESGHLGGVALDVYETEPCTDSPLFKLPRVLCTPHLGASTEEAQISVAVEAVELLVKYLKSGEVKHAVNAISIDPKTMHSLRGELDVAYRLGILMNQWHGGAIKRCQLEYRGEIAGHDTRLLTSAFCAGLLQNVVEGVSIINSEVLCRDRGIEVATTSTREHGAFSSVISTTVEGEKQTFQASGTVFGKSMPRLVGLSDYQTDGYMDGILLIFTHRDVPGVIAYVGKLLADENVNIAQMAVGRSRHEQGGPAIGILNLDSSPSAEAVEKVMEHDGIESAKIIRLPSAGELPDWLA
jgi:D-3-phosphoglycerate dehydrogenase